MITAYASAILSVFAACFVASFGAYLTQRVLYFAMREQFRAEHETSIAGFVVWLESLSDDDEVMPAAFRDFYVLHAEGGAAS